MDENSPTIEASFKIIASVGGAKSMYLQAVESAKEGDFDEADAMMKQADDAFHLGHDVHLKLLQDTALGSGPEVSLILLHAEDQMMGAETVRIMAQNLIDVYQRLSGK